MGRPLVYDVGVNDGKDSAYYLARGFRVVGVEASPVMAEQLRSRFAGEIQQGDFILLNAAVAEDEGEAEFWLSDHSEWSSFDKARAARDGFGCRAVSVKTRPFRSILEEHGRPYFCKIDIEGYDRLCLRGFDPGTAPDYISVELALQDPVPDLELLRALGFSRFKIISQMTWSQPLPLLTRLQCALPWRAAALLRQGEKRFRGVRAVEDWAFAFNSSGPFGEDTPGPWRTYDDILQLYGAMKSVEDRRVRKGLHDWFDIHAAH